MYRKFCNITQPAIKTCIIGAGPAGFYTAQQLLKLIPTCTIDIYEKLPCPFGLVRFGVAPDHAEVKNVINTFTKTATHPRVNFYGNLSLGRDFSLRQLQEAYHIVLLTYGAEEDNKLNIPGENLKNVISAREFVGWYNGLPSSRNLKINLDTEKTVIIGQGNVAIDVARILLSPIDKLMKTDITQHALDELAHSKIKQVELIGRRGPIHVAFTIKELRELLKLPNVCTIFNRDDFLEIPELIPNLGRPRKRITELLYKAATEDSKIGEKVLKLVFKRSPVEITGSGSVDGIKLAVNQLKGDVFDQQKAVATEECETVPCGLVFKSIGYRSIQADLELPYNAAKGVLKNTSGKINQGLYCSGWLSTGPIGVIIATMNNSFATAQLIADDFKSGQLDVETCKPGSDYILKKCRERGIQVVDFEMWKKIDLEEQKRGANKNKPREKIVEIDEMLRIAGE